MTLKIFEIDKAAVSCFKTVFLTQGRPAWIRLEAGGEGGPMSNTHKAQRGLGNGEEDEDSRGTEERLWPGSSGCNVQAEVGL